MEEQQSRVYPIQEHMSFQRRSWTIERVGWLVMLGILALALAGLFGGGALSRQTIGQSPLSVEYDRFQRITKLARFTIRLGGSETERRLTLGPAFQSHYEVSDIQPQPLRSSAGADGLDMQFAAGAGELSVVIWAHPRKFGSVKFTVSGAAAQPLELSPFVYP
jgi:hypothetical protein